MPPKIKTRPAITIPAIAPPFNAGAAAAAAADAPATAAAFGADVGAIIVGGPLGLSVIPTGVGANVTGFFVG